jgi:hypothetical protein
MTGNRLMTLKEIADELGVNYKTLLSCKERFANYVLGVPVGRHARYPGEFMDFFRLVFALFDEGYNSGKVRHLLEYGVQSPEDSFIEDWIEEWRNWLSRTVIRGNGSDRHPWSKGQMDDGLTHRLTDLLTG